MLSTGAKCWVIPEGYDPGESVSDDPKLISYETACFLNKGDRDAQISITLCFEDRQPLVPCRLSVGAHRTRRMRFTELSNPARVPRHSSYALLIGSSEPVLVQHTRPDSRDPHSALPMTMACAQA